MKIYLRNNSPELVKAWAEFFKNTDVECSCGDIFQLGVPVDAIVSPANSFGYMDGGIDYIYSLELGWEMSEALRHRIKTQFNGELLVGQATTIDIRALNPKAKIPYLISAPTMRVPAIVKGTVNAYLAFRAVLLELRNQPQIKSILCPGLGTGVGEIPPYACAAQMFAAYSHFYGDNKPPEYETLGFYHKFHHIMVGNA